MNNSADKLLDVLKPLIVDLDDKKENLSLKKDELENVSRLLAYTKDDIEMVSIYANQELIINNLDKINSDKDEYKASCYLLKSENQSIKNLPQYKKAVELITNIIDYFKIYKAELIGEIHELETVCQQKSIDKKYYDILKEDEPYIEDANEYIELLENNLNTNKEIIDMILFAINKNNNKYGIKEC